MYIHTRYSSNEIVQFSKRILFPVSQNEKQKNWNPTNDTCMSGQSPKIETTMNRKYTILCYNV